MKYLILIYRDEALPPTATGQEVSAAHVEFMQRNAEVLRGGASLEASTTATSVREDGGGGFSLTDGPFAESKESFGGYYLIEVDDLDRALEVAKQVPIPDGGGVEVRPVRVAS